ncbi:MAG: branched-chain amino acid ABC transporter permease [Candidatus Heimdallarchaeota archaeon]|nr:MAG: branched-chain amino acid ABC transporter permease [Candidatus Heimdallarchaeota archaeon]
MEWREVVENIWDELTDRSFYIIAVTILILAPLIVATPPSNLPIFNIIYNGSRVPILSDIYDLGRNIGLFGTNNWMMNILSLCLIWAIFAASWDFLAGYSGQVSFGHAAFWGFSAYVAYWVAAGFNVIIPIINLDLGFNFELDPILALIFGGLMSALLACGLGIVSLRVKGFYLALVTLVIPLIFYSLANTFRELTGGNYGLQSDVTRVVPLPPEGPLFRETLALNFYIFVLLMFFIIIGFMMLIAFSRIGLAFQSVREDEDAAESLGINIRNYKILAFTLSAFFAGIAGGLYAQWFNYVSPTYLESAFSFQVIIMCVIGGIGTITGGIIGAFLLIILVNVFLKSVFSDVHGLDMLSFGLLLIITLRYMPFGLSRSTKDQKRAIVLGILFALAWTILPSSDGWGVEFFSSILPNNGQAKDPLSQLISITVTSILTLVGKIDSLGQMATSLTTDNFLTFIILIIMFIFSIPAILIFLISEIVGLFLFESIMGINLIGGSLIKAKFLIFTVVGIPFAFYLPKIFKALRLRYWGVWPSVGRYEPD